MSSTKSTKPVLSWLSGVIGKNSKWILALTFVQVCQGVFGVIFALELKRVVDFAILHDKKQLIIELVILSALALISIILQAVGKVIDEKARVNLDKAFRQKAFSELLNRSYGEVMNTHSGEWMNRIVSDTNVVVSATVQIIPNVVGTIVRLLGAMIALAVLLPDFILLLIPAGALIAIVSRVFRKKLKIYHKQAQSADGKVRSFMQERLSSLIVVKSFTQEKQTEKMSAEYMDTLGKIRMKRVHFVNLCTIALHLAMRGAYVIGVVVCTINIVNGLMTYGTMMAILQLVTQVETPFAQISSFLPQYYSMIASAERLMEIEKLEKDINTQQLAEESIKEFYEKEFASVGLQKAYFSYKDAGDGKTHVLDNMSVDIQKGEYVAFVGESGCGKSTAMKLMMCLYPLDKGGRYLKTTSGEIQALTSDYRGLFAYVPQGNFLVSGTIREILTFSNEKLMADDEGLNKALAIACADGFVNDLPNGIDTELGELGSGLSEGQTQRLAIARAIMSERPILMLDEATSALDSVTEEKVLQNIRTMTDRTVIIITHRPAALTVCDKKIQF